MHSHGMPMVSESRHCVLMQSMLGPGSGKHPTATAALYRVPQEHDLIASISVFQGGARTRHECGETVCL